jgi:hypothetical protein
MKLFAKPLLSWKEPTWFGVSMRSRRGWLLHLLFFLLVFAGMSFGFYADRNWGKGPGRNWGVLQAELVCLLIAVVLTGVLQLRDLGREIGISDSAVTAFAQAGTFVSTATWALKDLAGAEIVRPQELSKPFGVLYLELRKTRRWRVALGVPSDVRPERIAEVLHGVGVPVRLSGWAPGAAAAPVPPPAPRTDGAAPSSVEVSTVPSPYAGRVLARKNVAELIGCLPLLALLVPGVIAVVYGLLKRNEMPLEELAVWVACGAAAALTGILFGRQFQMFYVGRALLRAARAAVRERPDALVNPDDSEAVFVEVLPREGWGEGTTKTGDVGFLRVDEAARCLLFEGDAERWRVPAGSVIACEVEPASVRAGQQDEAVVAQYVAVLKARAGDGVWERPLARPHLELRWLKNRHREAKARALRELIVSRLRLSAPDR